MTSRWARAGRLMIGALLLVGPTLVVGTADPAAAAEGVLAVEPAEGKSDWGKIRLITNRGCPAKTTNVIVEIVGANFPPGSFALGNSEISGFPTAANGQGLVLPLFGSWDAIAEANGGKRTLDGTAELTLICIDQPAEKSLAEITGEIRFRKSTDGPSAFEQASGPRLVSGFPYQAADVVPYVYRYDLPPGSPGGPPVGGPTEPPGVAAANAALTGANGAAGEAAAESPDDLTAEDNPSGGPEMLEPGDADATQATNSDRSSGASSTPLIVGLVVLAGAATAGYVAYDRARRQTPAEY